MYVAGSALAFVPAASLAEGESYRLRLGADLTDRVGHPLTPVEVTFTVAVGVLGAPVLDPVPAVVGIAIAGNPSGTGRADSA